MEYISIAISILLIIIGLILTAISVNLVKTIKNNSDKTVENIANKINKASTAVAILTIIESALLIVNIIIR